MTKETETIYQQRILDHYKNPSHHGKPSRYTHQERGVNPLCGDEVEFYATIEGPTMRTLHFTSSACAICTAASSLIAERLQGARLTAVELMTNQDVIALLGIQLTPLRLKCALLPLMTVKNLVKN